MNNPNFCNNCGQKIETETEINECPKCHSALHEHSEHIQTSHSTGSQQLPYKSPGTSALIAFIGGLFGLPGIGYMYVGKVGKGIGILLVDLAVFVSTIFLALVYLPMVLILSIGYLVIFVWQIFNARKLAIKFNELVRTTGKEPW